MMTPAREQDPELAGTWIGVYQVYPSFVQLTLKIAADQTGAEIRVEGLEGKNAAHMGVAPATVRYEPDSRTLEIHATQDAYRRSPLMGLAFHAVYDAERGAFAGYRLNASNDASPYFVLVRQGQEGRALKRLYDMPNGAAPMRPGFPLGGSSPSADTLRTWASQIYNEYPTIDPYRTESGGLYSMARNLFRDEYFTSHFGKPFDQLSTADLGRIARRLDEFPAPRANFPEDKANAAGRSVSRGFLVLTGTYAAPDITLSVIALRSIAAWMNQTMRRLPALAPAADSFVRLSVLEAEERSVLSGLWPSERAAFLKLIGEQRARLADPVLSAMVNRLISSAVQFEDVPSLRNAASALQQPRAVSAPRAAAPPVPMRRGMPAAPVRRAESAGDGIGSLASMASDSLRQQLRASIETKSAALVDAEAKKDAASIAEFPAGTAGLEAGARWFAAADRKFSAYRSVPAVSALFEQFARVRGQQFGQAAGEWKARIAVLQSADEIKAVLARYTGVSSDSSNPAAQPLYAAAREREQELGRAAAERARAAAAEVARREQEAREKAEKAWRRRMPSGTEKIRIGLMDMNPKPGSKPLQQAVAAVFTVLTSKDTMGSAFIVTKDGLAITNNHVVEGASALQALFPSGQRFAARVWRTDPQNDFALIQIDCPKDCHTSYLTGDPLPAPGTDIYAIGTPRELQYVNTITKGIVSGLRRSGGKIDIQSDVAINSGNSGGPMIEAETGRVIGVVTKKRTDSEGIGFAGSILDAMRTLGIILE